MFRESRESSEKGALPQGDHRQLMRVRGCLHTGSRAQLRGQLVRKVLELWDGIAAAGKRQLKRQHAGSVIAWIDRESLRKLWMSSPPPMSNIMAIAISAMTRMDLAPAPVSRRLSDSPCPGRRSAPGRTISW